MLKTYLLKTLMVCLMFNPVWVQSEELDTLLWKVSGDDWHHDSYLYGTMHITCGKTGVDKAKVQQAIDLTDQLYLEIDESNDENFETMMKIIDDDLKIKDIDDSIKRQQLLALSAKHLQMNGEILKETGLFMLFSMISMQSIAQCKDVQSVENQLMANYNQQSKPIKGLETMDQQYQALKKSGLIDLDAVLFFLNTFEESLPYSVQLTELYGQEKLSNLYALMTTPSEVMLQQHIDGLVTHLLGNRNRNWVPIIAQEAKQKATFFAVGAGHLLGENGVIQLLRRQGYQVEAVVDG